MQKHEQTKMNGEEKKVYVYSIDEESEIEAFAKFQRSRRSP